MTVLPKWFYNEFQQIGVDFEDTARVEAYDHNQRSSSEEAERELVEWLGISVGHIVIDLGAGTGTFAIQASKAGARVHAVDVSPTMLAYTQQKAHAINAQNIQFHHAGFLSYEHRGDRADFIVTKAAFHHLPDFWKMVALLRMASMLKAGGFSTFGMWCSRSTPVNTTLVSMPGLLEWRSQQVRALAPVTTRCTFAKNIARSDGFSKEC
jgi:ubiquinone/menaquinone biosynthesis C-methylase UbiE